MLYETFQALQLADHALLFGLAPWRAVFLVLSLPAAVLIILLYWVSDPRKNVGEHDDQTDPESTGTKSGMLYAAIFLGLIMLSFTDNAAIGWIPAVFSREYGFSVADSGTVFAAIAIVGGSIGPLAGGWAGDRVYRRWGPDGRLAACSAAAGLLGILYLSFISGVVGVLIASLVFIAILITGVGTVGMVVIQEVLPDRLRGLGTGLTYSFGMLIAGNGPTAVAMVNEWAYSGQHTGVAITTICTPTAFMAASLFALGVLMHRRIDGQG
jgi:MFS family permease